MPTIVIIGESGQLAQSLKRLEWPRGWALELVGRRRVASGDPATIADAAAALKPDLLLNAAAYTSVDRAEVEREAAVALNAELPRRLANLAQRLSIPLVHVSTDYVFDGEKRAPYLESDTPNPINVYGASKLAGDRAIEQAQVPHWAILRSSWVISEIGDTFPVKLLKRARTGVDLRVVEDQVGCPTSAHFLARAIQKVGLRLLDGDEASRGLFNCCGLESMSWFDLAELVLAQAARHGLRSPPLHRISSAQLAAQARRPANSALSCARIMAQCQIEPESCAPMIERLVPAILASAP